MSIWEARIPALFYTLIESARHLGVEPAAYPAAATRRAIDKPRTVTPPFDLADRRRHSSALHVSLQMTAAPTQRSMAPPCQRFTLRVNQAIQPRKALNRVGAAERFIESASDAEPLQSERLGEAFEQRRRRPGMLTLERASLTFANVSRQAPPWTQSSRPLR